MTPLQWGHGLLLYIRDEASSAAALATYVVTRCDSAQNRIVLLYVVVSDMNYPRHSMAGRPGLSETFGIVLLVPLRLESERR